MLSVRILLSGHLTTYLCLFPLAVLLVMTLYRHPSTPNIGELSKQVINMIFMFCRVCQLKGVPLFLRLRTFFSCLSSFSVEVSQVRRPVSLNKTPEQLLVKVFCNVRLSKARPSLAAVLSSFPFAVFLVLTLYSHSLMPTVSQARCQNKSLARFLQCVDLSKRIPAVVQLYGPTIACPCSL